MWFFQHSPHFRRFRRRAAQRFASYTSGPATKAMRNEINKLIDSISDPTAQKVKLFGSCDLYAHHAQAFAAEMQGFIHLYKQFAGEGANSEHLFVNFIYSGQPTDLANASSKCLGKNQVSSH